MPNIISRILALGFLVLPIAAQATIITTSGSLTSPPEGNFDTFNFNQDLSGATSLFLASDTDAYLLLFSGMDVFTNATFIAQNDDGGGGLNSLLNLTLAAGSYTAYITSHGTYWDGSSFEIGHDHLPMNYTLEIEGDVSAGEPPMGVPEPGTLALLGLGLAGFAIRSRRKNL